MSDFMSRVASAPISWGICEVPGWGAMLPTPRVLAEMSGLGLPATELGAPGFLPDSPELVQAELAKFDMSLIGGFTPLVLQDPAQREATIAEARRVAALFERAGATKFITAAVVDMDWSEPGALSAEQVRHMAMMFGIVDEICAEHGLDRRGVVPDVLACVVPDRGCRGDGAVQDQRAQSLGELLRIGAAEGRAVAHPPEADLVGPECAAQRVDVTDDLPTADKLCIGLVRRQALLQCR